MLLKIFPIPKAQILYQNSQIWSCCSNSNEKDEPFLCRIATIQCLHSGRTILHTVQRHLSALNWNSVPATKEEKDFPIIFKTNHHLAIPFWSSNTQVLLRPLKYLLKIEWLRLLVIDDPDSEIIECEDDEFLNRPRNENILRKARPNPPPPFDLPLLDPQAIRLGAPLLLNPPSISVKTAGSSRSPVLLPPENLPTANPPPGSLHMVSPTASSSADRSPISRSEGLGDSVGSSWRQTGHELRRESQGRMQSEW